MISGRHRRVVYGPRRLCADALAARSPSSAARSRARCGSRCPWFRPLLHHSGSPFRLPGYPRQEECEAADQNQHNKESQHAHEVPPLEPSSNRLQGRRVVHDASITSKIVAKMALDDLVKARTIDVTTDGPIVTLSGRVHSQTERERALRLARETDVEQVVTLESSL